MGKCESYLKELDSDLFFLVIGGGKDDSEETDQNYGTYSASEGKGENAVHHTVEVGLHSREEK